jgi:muramidase (phage lysozyme)
MRMSLKRPYFTPENQDAGAVMLIADANALDAVNTGNVQKAIERCSPIWASLPNARYPQPRRTLEYALNAYEDAGGVVG